MGLFNNLILNVTQESALAAISAGASAASKKFDGTVKLYTSKPYESIIAYSAKRDAMQKAFAELNNLYPSLVKKAEMKKAKESFAQNQEIDHRNVANTKDIPSDQFKQSIGLKWKYKALDHNEGLLMWIKNPQITAPKRVYFDTYWGKVKGLSYKDILDQVAGGSGKDRETYVEVPGECVFMDMTAITQMNSSKNLVLTKVQGRDCSRKELISNGDIQFTVNGKIVGNYPDVYPYAEVSTFLELMQYKGMVQVYGLLFEQLKVTRVLIKDFRLSQQVGFKNVQPYSFTCVAVEPDSKVEQIEDTLIHTNLSFAQKKKGPWAKMLKTIADSAAEQAAITIEKLTADII